MKLVVFGASRGVGFQVVKQALEAGHKENWIHKNNEFNDEESNSRGEKFNP